VVVVLANDVLFLISDSVCVDYAINERREWEREAK